MKLQESAMNQTFENDYSIPKTEDAIKDQTGRKKTVKVNTF